MRHLFFAVLATFFISCNSSSADDVAAMPGTYYMNSQTITDGEVDTKYTDLKQLKIYTDDYFMYVQVNPVDSFSAFGVGYYSSDTAGVTENVIYSAKDTSFNQGTKTFNLNISETFDGYEQVILEITLGSKKYKLTEVYDQVATTEDSPLDGIWKETEAYDVVGNDTIAKNRVQYKGFYDGYFMFGHTYIDSTSEKRTGIGFGTFEYINDNKISETDLNSTYAIIAGHTFDVNFEMDGDNHFKQTITKEDGSKVVEFYERLKK